MNRQGLRRLTAWILAFAMIFSGASFPAKADANDETPELTFTLEATEGEGAMLWTGSELGLYEGQTVSMTVNDTTNDITWSVYDMEDFEENGIDATKIDNAVSIEKSQGAENTYDLTASLLDDGENEKSYILYAAETADSDALSCVIYFFIRRRSYDYNYPLCGAGSNYVFPMRDLYLDSHIGCWVENPSHPYGEYLETEITSVEIINGDEFLECIPNEDGSYQLRGLSCGRAEIKVTYVPLEGDGAKNFYTREIFVTNDIYYLNWEYPNGTDMMLKGSSMTIDPIVLSHGHLDWDEETGVEDEQWEEAVQYSLEIEPDSYDNDLINVQIEDHSVIITAVGNYGGTSLFLRGKIGDEFLGETEIGIQVTDGYINLFPASVENVPIGQTLDLDSIAWNLTCYSESEFPDGKDIFDIYQRDQVRFRAEYDENAWVMTAGIDDGKLPTLMRKANWGTSVTVIAEGNPLDSEGNPILDENGERLWEELTRRDLWFDELEYRIDFSQSYGHPDNSRFFIDAPLTLTPKTSEDSPYELPEGFTVEWTVKQYMEDGTETTPDFVDVMPADDMRSVTLSFQSENGEEKFGTWFEVHAAVFYDGNEISSTQRSFIIAESIYSYDEPLSGPGGSEMILGGSLFIGASMHCWTENADYPFGVDSEQKIKSAEISGHYIWDNEQQNWSSTDTQIVRLEGDSENGWVLYGESCGMATIKITYEPAEGDINPAEREINVYVNSDIYHLNWNYPEGRGGQMLLDSEMTLTDFSVMHEWVSEDSGNYYAEEVTNFSLFVTFDGEEPTYNTDLFEITADGKELTIRSTGQIGSDAIYLRAMRGGNELCGTNIYMDVVEDYYQIFCDDIIAAPGETFSIQELNPSLRHFSSDHPDGTTENAASFRFIPSSDDKMEVTENSVTISESYVSEEWPQEEMIDIFADVEEEDFSIGGAARVSICKHDWEEGGIATAPSCETAGEKTFICRHCGKTRSETIAATGHNWDAGKITKNSSCETDGEKTFTCSQCGKMRSEAVAATGHSWDAGKNAKSPSCETAGERIFTCGLCGKTRSEAIAATGHSWGAWTTKEEATALQKAKQMRSCSICHAAESREYGDPLKATIKLAASGLKMKTNQKATVSLVTGLAKGDSVLSIKSDKSKILKVSNVKPSGSCKLTAQKKTGTAKLTIKLASGLTKTIKVTVQKKTVKTTKISGLPKNLTLKKGASQKLAVVLTPLTSQQKVTYSTSDKKVVTVDGKGKLKAKKSGKAKITVKSGSKKITINVTVKAK